MSPEILMCLAYFFIQCSEADLPTLCLNRNFSTTDLLAKINLEIIELFGDIYQIVKIETPVSPELLIGRPIISYNVLEEPRLPYGEEVFPKFFSLQSY